MKDLIGRLIKQINKPAYKVNTSVFIVIAYIAIIFGEKLNPHVSIIISIVMGLVCLSYSILCIVKQQSISLILVSLVGVLFSILIIVKSYFEVKGISIDILIIFIPMLLILLFGTGYVHVIKCGDINRIKKAKSAVAIGMPFSIIALVMVIWILNS